MVVFVQRDKLLSYLEDSAKNEADWEDCVPFVSGQKRGKIFEDEEGDNENKGEKDMEMPIELDVEDEDEEELGDVSGHWSFFSRI